MPVPTLPHLILLFFLGGVFIHFTFAGARTFHFRTGDAGPASVLGQGVFVFGGVVPIWWLGLYQPIHLLNGVISAGLLVVSIGLYEWARAIIWGRRFGLAWGEHVPEEICESGPYRFVRHPLYTSYLLAFVAALVALPHWITAFLVAANSVLWVIAARNDESRIARSPLAWQYAEYRKRAGMFWPKPG